MTNSEGGTDDEEFRNAAVVDRVNTTMTVWMAASMACAQCHTHKYDPYSQKEYYGMFAIFNNSEDADRPDEAPVMEIYTAEQKVKRTQLTQDIRAATDELLAPTPEKLQAFESWGRRLPLE